MAAVFKQPQSREWNSGKAACCSDMKACCCVTFCGSCYVCWMAKRFGNENCCAGWPFCLGTTLTTAALRYKLRYQGEIKGSLCKDLMATFCCTPCVICQLKREYDSMGMGVVKE